MLVFFEMRTINPDGELIIIRYAEKSIRDALLSLYARLCIGFYVAKDQKSTLVSFQKPYHSTLDTTQDNWGSQIKDWMYPNAPSFVNDLGGVTTLCIHEYGEASQVTEGVFKL